MNGCEHRYRYQEILEGISLVISVSEIIDIDNVLDGHFGRSSLWPPTVTLAIKKKRWPKWGVCVCFYLTSGFTWPVRPRDAGPGADHRTGRAELPRYLYTGVILVPMAP